MTDPALIRCTACGRDRPHYRSGRCQECCPVNTTTRACKGCGERFYNRAGRNTYCSRECREAHGRSPGYRCEYEPPMPTDKHGRTYAVVHDVVNRWGDTIPWLLDTFASRAEAYAAARTAAEHGTLTGLRVELWEATTEKVLKTFPPVPP